MNHLGELAPMMTMDWKGFSFVAMRDFVKAVTRLRKETAEESGTKKNKAGTTDGKDALPLPVMLSHQSNRSEVPINPSRRGFASRPE